MSEYIYATDEHKGHWLTGEKIVRCRDCDYYDHLDASGPYREKHVCGYWNYLEIELDGFCAWGERRDDA